MEVDLNERDEEELSEEEEEGSAAAPTSPNRAPTVIEPLLKHVRLATVDNFQVFYDFPSNL